jgi:hypothetical protein
MRVLPNMILVSVSNACVYTLLIVKQVLLPAFSDAHRSLRNPKECRRSGMARSGALEEQLYALCGFRFIHRLWAAAPVDVMI